MNPRADLSSRCRALASAALLALALVLCGCGGTPVGTVSGNVSYKGTLLKGGTVTFVNKERTAFATAPIGTDGSYTAEKVPTGEVLVGVETISARPIAVMPKGIKIKAPEGVELPEVYRRTGARYVAIPEHYSQPDKSGLTYTVTPGPQSKDFELK